MSERVRTEEAAKEIGVGVQSLREYMKRGIWDLGEVIPPQKGGSSHHEYLIFREKLDRFLGKEVKS